MAEGFALRCADARWNTRGRLRADVQALLDDELVAADTVSLGEAKDRRRFAEQIREQLNGRAPAGEEIEGRLLALLAKASADDADGADGRAPAEGDANRRVSQADQLVALATEALLFHDPAGDTDARVTVADHEETWPTRSKGFRRYLARTFYERHQKAPNAQAMQDALAVIEARAQFDGPCQSVYLRVVPDSVGGYYLDLGDPTWRAVHVTPFGWQVVGRPPVFFRRSPGMPPLPMPVGGRRLDELRTFVNVPDDGAWALIKAWLVAAIRDCGPYPVLVLNGEQGSAKTTLARMLRALVDPATPELRSDPRELRDLAIAARATWVVAFDNVSHLQPWLSDALCRLATGGGWATREMYADLDEILFEARRPVILNGITEFVARPDLLDRAIQVVLSEIEDDRRQDEEELWPAFEAARPRLLGALLDAAAGALAALPDVRLARKPRMADFARWAVAAERAEAATEPAPSDAAASPFLAAYAGIREEGWHQALEASAVGPALVELLEEALADGPWRGRAKDLLGRLNERADDQARRGKDWPKTPKGLSNELRRLVPALRGIGIVVTFGERGGHQGSRIITIRKRTNMPPDKGAAAPSAPSAPSAPEQDGTARADGAPGPADDSGPAADGHADGATRIADGADGPAATFSAAGDVQLITSPSELKSALPVLLAAPTVGLDCETTGLDPRRDQLRLVQLAVPDRTYVVDCFRLDSRALVPVIDGARRLVGHNLAFDLSFLAAAGLPVPDGG